MFSKKHLKINIFGANNILTDFFGVIANTQHSDVGERGTLFLPGFSFLVTRKHSSELLF